MLAGPGDPADVAAYARFIARRLIKPVSHPDASMRAAAETEFPIEGDLWFWADDNAKILSALARPALVNEFRDEVISLQRFLTSLCSGPFIFRRRSEPRLDFTQAGDGIFKVITSLVDFHFDLRKGVVTAGLRFHDGRQGTHLSLAGNYFCFTLNGRRQTVDVEDTIIDIATEHTPEEFIARHRSRITDDTAPSSRLIGYLTYEYRVHKKSARLRMTASFTNCCGERLDDVITTIALDNMSHHQNNVHYGAIRALTLDRQRIEMGPSQGFYEGFDGACIEYMSVTQKAELVGFALGVHVLFEAASAATAIRVNRHENGDIHWAGFEKLSTYCENRQAIVFGANVWISGGGFYDLLSEYAALLGGLASGNEENPLDISISYDYGAEIEALSACYTAANFQKGVLGWPPGWAEQCREQFDRYIEVYWKRFIDVEYQGVAGAFVRPLSLVAVGLCEMFEATGAANYRNLLEKISDELIQFAHYQTDVAGERCVVFTMGRTLSKVPYVDCHSSAIIALARLYTHTPRPIIRELLDLSLRSFSIRTTGVDFGGLKKQDVIGIDFLSDCGARIFVDGFWNFTAGLALRALNAVKLHKDPAIREVYDSQRRRMAILESLIGLQLNASLRASEDFVEVRTSVLSSEGNSETQPWVMQGIFPNLVHK